MFSSKNLLGALLSSGFGGHNRRMASRSRYGGGLSGGMLGGHRGMSLGKGAAIAMLGGLALNVLQKRMEQQGARQPSAASPSGATSAGAAVPGVGAAPAGGAPAGGAPSAGAVEPDEDRALLLVRAMIAAANADMHIDAEERGRILAKLEEAGADPEERAFVEREMGRPRSIDELAREATGPDVAVQVYAAALTAIDIDTAMERRFLQHLAERLRLEPDIVREIHQQLGEPPPQA
jgi:uncharacterized membrane protein YebE (DUF533 family)